MCGILGFNWSDKELAKKLGDLISHRGPDDEGYFFDKDLSLVHRRLSIIDLSKKGHQPMCDDTDSYQIVFNGEVFNFQEIKDELILKGYKFKSKTDTEVILSGYIEYGYKILEKLNGQFAFCIYDKKKQELFLARDRLGINPLYYYFEDSKFIFGSELKIILESEVKKEIDKFSLNYYFMYGHTPRNKTIIKNVFKVEPAHYMIFNLKESKIKQYNKYWTLNITGEITDEKLAKSLILEQLEKSVRSRLIGDVPVGAFLSGGVDSSAVVAIMSKYAPNLNTFSIKFDHDDFDESKYADIISKKFNTKHHVIKFTSKDVKKLIPQLIYHYDEPFGDSSMIATFLVSKVARKHVTISLSGDGGDELFGGYQAYKNYRLLNYSKFIPKIISKTIFSLLNLFSSERLTLPKAYFEISSLNRKLQYAKIMSYLTANEFVKITGENPVKYYKEYSKYFKRDNFLNEAIISDINNYLPEDILTKVDRASLGNSLESRPPILNHDLVELSARIHPSLKLKGNEGKYIFKKALEEILPNRVLYRKKQGFGVPLKHYFRGDLRDLVDDYVINYKKHNFVNSEILVEIKKNLNKKHCKKDYSRVIWSILMFNLWYEKWMKK